MGLETENTETGGVVRETRDLIENYLKPETGFISISDAGRSISVPVVKYANSIELLDPCKIEPWATRPRLRTGTATLLSIDALIDHVNRFKDAESIVFADNNRSAPTVTAVLDYHPAGGQLDSTAPRLGKHRSHYAFPLSDEWVAWNKANKAPMKMAAFAEFLEERIVDVIGMIAGEDTVSEELQKYINACGGVDTIADPAKLMDLARGLHVHEDSVVTEAVRLSSGEGQVSFEVTHRDASGNKLVVPNLFLIAIPIFKNGISETAANPFYRIAARLRYRKTGEGIVFWYDLWRLDRSFDHAFNEACERVRVETDLPLLLGRPE